MLRIVEETQHGILRGVCTISAVIANKSDAPGLSLARDRGLKTLCVPSKGKEQSIFEDALLTTLDRWNPDYLVLAGFMRVLSPSFVAHFPKRIINIHPADTKLHQGLGAYKWAFANKLKETKVTIHFVDEGVDTGEIIAQFPVDLTGVTTEAELEKRGLAVEHQIYSKVLRDILI